MTHQNASGAVSPVGGNVIAAGVGGGIGSAAIRVSRRRSSSIRPVPVAMAMARITVAGVAAGAVGRGATFDAAKIGLAATLEAMQSASTIETRRTTGDVARKCARAPTERKASERSDSRTTERRTANAWTERRTAGTEARRGTSDHRWRTRGRAELRQCSIGRCDDGSEQYARGQGEKGLSRHCVYPSGLARFSHITLARAREFAQGFVGVFRTSFRVAPETRGRWNHWWCCGCSEEEGSSGPSGEAAG